MRTPNKSVEPSITSIDELSSAILAWLDERPPSLVRRSASSSWSSRELRSTFQDNLYQALRAAAAAASWAALISYLVDKFAMRSSGDVARTREWAVALRQGSAPDTFRAMRTDITELLQRESGERPPLVPSPGRLADAIVDALSKSLEAEAARAQVSGDSPISVLRHYMVPDALRKKYNVRLFLFFVGLCVPIFIIFTVAEPNSWLNPATAAFVILGYATLVTTALVHEHSNRVPE